MGQYRITIEAIGNHGCDRQAKDGAQVYGCGRLSCVDCRTRDFLETLKRSTSSMLTSATLTHWPGSESEVEDNLLTHERRGNF